MTPPSSHCCCSTSPIAVTVIYVLCHQIPFCILLLKRSENQERLHRPLLIAALQSDKGKFGNTEGQLQQLFTKQRARDATWTWMQNELVRLVSLLKHLVLAPTGGACDFAGQTSFQHPSLNETLCLRRRAMRKPSRPWSDAPFAYRNKYISQIFFSQRTPNPLMRHRQWAWH